VSNFDVSYFIRLRDQFSRQADKVTGSSIRLKKSLAAVSRQAKNVGRSMTDAGKKLTLFATVPLALAAKSLVDAASNAQEVGNRFKEVFTGLEAERNTVVEDLGKQFHLAASSSQELLSDSGDLLSGLGLTTSEALELSRSMIALSADVTSFKNVNGGVARTMNAFTKALLGEREMLKETFKISILESEVKEAANALMAKNIKLTEKQARAFATVNIITRKSKNALGDYNKTQDDYANLTRRASERTKELKEKFGTILLPVMVDVATRFIDVINKINAMSEDNKKLILQIVGVVAALGPLALVVGAVSIIIGGLAAVLGLLSLPVLAVIAGAVLLGNALYGLYSNFDTIVTSISNLFTMLADVAIKTLKSISNAIVNFLLAPIKLAAEGMAALGFDGMKNKIMEFQRKITFETGDKKLGIDANSTAKSQADVNINVNAPKGVVSSTTTKRRGDPMNLGMSMRTQP